MKYSVITFGCRVNQADSLGFEEQLRARGATEAPPDQADLVIVNTCSVTASADQSARQAVRRLARTNPDAKVVVTGCYATRQPDEFRSLPNVLRVVSNDTKAHLVSQLDLTTSERFGDGEGSCGAAVEPGVAGRTAFTLRVQTGCAQPCAYCIIPTTRGAPRSVSIEAVLEDVDRVVIAGFKEIALTGVHLGSYGRDLTPSSSLVELLGRLERDAATRWHGLKTVPYTPGKGLTRNPRTGFDPDPRTGFDPDPRTRFDPDPRTRFDPDPRTDFGRGRSSDRPNPDILFRISSLEPMDCTPEIVDLVASSECFAPHFHLPLQHASNRVLSEMRRPYTLEHYARLVDTIRRRMPHASIGSDIIVGFPRETDEDFEELCGYLERSPLTHVHVFPYSDRPGTVAASMSGKVPGGLVRARASRVREIGQRLKQAFRQSQLGTVHRGLTLEDGSLVVTANYLKVRIPPGRRRNEWVRVRITGTADAMLGEVVAG